MSTVINQIILKTSNLDNVKIPSKFTYTTVQNDSSSNTLINLRNKIHKYSSVCINDKIPVSNDKNKENNLIKVH